MPGDEGFASRCSGKLLEAPGQDEVTGLVFSPNWVSCLPGTCCCLLGSRSSAVSSACDPGVAFAGGRVPCRVVPCLSTLASARQSAVSTGCPLRCAAAGTKAAQSGDRNTVGVQCGWQEPGTQPSPLPPMWMSWKRVRSWAGVLSARPNARPTAEVWAQGRDQRILLGFALLLVCCPGSGWSRRPQPGLLSVLGVMVALCSLLVAGAMISQLSQCWTDRATWISDKSTH